MSELISVKDNPPKNNITVMTKISDEQGERNKQPLKHNNNLWFFPDGSMYVYYMPTHWQPLPQQPLDRLDRSVKE